MLNKQNIICVPSAKLNHRFVYIIGPLMIKDSETEAFTLIGVACDGPYKWEQYRTGPYATYSKVSAVLPWIHETMQTN